MSVRRARGAASAAGRSRSQHFLRSSRLAAELVGEAEIESGDTVLEIGAGTGRLTAELARSAQQVIAVEIDVELVALLRRRFAGSNVAVIHGDALQQPLPTERFRVFANLPFHETTSILRHLLDDPLVPLARADLILQWETARKRAQVWPSTLLGAYWGAWYRFTLVRHLPAACFAPRPRVDAGLLSILARSRALVRLEDALRYRRFLQAGFAARRLDVGLAPFLAGCELKRLADVYGFRRDASAAELDLHQWAAVFHAASRSRA